MSFKDFEIIHTYLRKQAIDDGVLIDLNKYIPVNESQFKYPIACTLAVWALIQKAVNNKKYFNDYEGVICDIFNMMFFYTEISKGNNSDTIVFKVIITGAGKRKNYTFKSVCGPGDTGEPVITIMLPNED